MSGITFLLALPARVRAALLGGSPPDTAELPVNPQWGVFAVFAVLLVAGLLVIAWMVSRLARGGEARS